MEHFDLLVIGAGPAGIAAAMSGAAQKLRVALIERDQTGGVCLNAGCMPTKFLLTQGASDASSAFAAKAAMIARLRSGADAMLAKAGVSVIRGDARFEDAFTLRYDHTAVMAENIVIATGSSARMFPWLPSGKTFSPEAFLREPRDVASYAIVGGGVIGVEFAFLLAGLGKRVAVFEKESRILPLCDGDLVRKIERNLKKSGVDVNVGCEVAPAAFDAFDAVICAAGRVPNTAMLALEKAGVAIDARGFIPTDAYLRTNVPHIFAVGDVRGEHLYAYTAEHEGACAAKTAGGNEIRYDAGSVVSCVFSKPGYASVGLTEEQARSGGMTYRAAKKDLIAFSSAHIYGDTDGAVKMLVDAADRIVGVQILSKYAHELIATAAVAVSRRLTAREFADTVFIHPSVSEALTKTAEALCA
jgi:dihydrolipoamide dehydrogenase